MTNTCLWAWVAIVLTLPLIALLWATESTEQRIHRLRRQGASQRAIAERLGISVYRVRKALTSAA
jgi:DNA-binding NarL/FixJ family response regulator